MLYRSIMCLTDVVCPDTQGGSVLDVFKAIATEDLELPAGMIISPALRDLFGRLFDKDPATRITLQVGASLAVHQQ